MVIVVPVAVAKRHVAPSVAQAAAVPCITAAAELSYGFLSCNCDGAVSVPTNAVTIAILREKMLV